MPLKTLTAFIAFLLLFSNNFFSQEGEPIYLNDIRILASHNSYKKKPDPKVLKFLAKVKNKIGEENNPIQLEYGHELLSSQLTNYGIRGFELDIYFDAKGGKFSKPKVNAFICGLKNKLDQAELNVPGFKLLHIADIDYETNYFTLQSALVEIRMWSEMHPLHCPIFINLELKNDSPADASATLRHLGFKRATQFTAETYNLLDSVVLANFNTEQLFTPSDFRKDNISLRARISTEGWPLLSSCRGKIFFIMEGYNPELYTGKDSRPLFIYGELTDDNVIFLLRNDPIDNEIQINKLTDEYIVRTRTDAGTLEARANNYERFNAALNSNAQILSTDYYKADPAIGNFVIRIGKEFIFRKQ
jgi:hypothetical protein